MNVTRFFFGFCCFQVMAEEKSRCWIMWHQQLFFSGVGGGGMKRKMDRIGIILEQQSERKRSCVLYRVGSFHERTNSNVKTKRNEDINVKRSKWSFNITKTVRSILFILSNCLCPMMGFLKSFFERCCAICGRCNLCFWFDARVQFFFYWYRGRYLRSENVRKWTEFECLVAFGKLIWNRRFWHVVEWFAS